MPELPRLPHRWAETRRSDLEITTAELGTREFARPLHRRDGRRAYYRQLRDTLDTRGMKQFVADLRAREFPIPLLLVYAPRDPIVPPAVGDRLHALVPEAQFARLSGGSHFAHVDAVDLFLDAALPFLQA